MVCRDDAVGYRSSDITFNTIKNLGVTMLPRIGARNRPDRARHRLAHHVHAHTQSACLNVLTIAIGGRNYVPQRSTRCLAARSRRLSPFRPSFAVGDGCAERFVAYEPASLDVLACRLRKSYLKRILVRRALCTRAHLV